MKDFDIKNGPAGVGYRQHDGSLTSKRSQDVKLAYPVFFEMPDAVAVTEGIKDS
jgi:hypothetical protein